MIRTENRFGMVEPRVNAYHQLFGKVKPRRINSYPTEINLPMKHAPAIFLGLVTIAISVSASESEPLKRWDRVVCIQSPVASKPEAGKLCSAFLVNAQERLFLVTAGHASAETSRKSRLVYRDRTGKSQWVSLAVLFSASSNPWHRDKTSDFAIAEVASNKNGKAYRSQLLELSIPLASVCTTAQPRTTRIDTAGFPLAIGTNEPVSAVAVVGHIASGELESDNDWGREPIVFCTPALAQGTSGGPAFLNDQRHDAVTVVGMYIGVVQDASGAKLSKMVPSRLIHAGISAIVHSSDGG